MATQNDEAWETYIAERKLVLDGTRYVVGADDLKQVTKREPRLLAKFDTRDELPKILDEHGYSILPITNGQYLLFQGTVFQELPPIENLERLSPNLPFPLETAGRGIGEMQYLDHAFNIGMLSNFVSSHPLYLTIRGRERCREFSFVLAGQQVKVNGVQIEVDGGYEGKQEIILIEAKIGAPTSFNIRQLYYPFRRFSNLVPSKVVRPIFFAYDFKSGVYSMYEFVFRDVSDPNSLLLVRSQRYMLPPRSRLKMDSLEDDQYASRDSERRLAPQADDLNKIIQLLQVVDQGYVSSDDLALYFNFDPRQSSYYAEAAEYLGLVERSRGTVSLSPRGNEFILTSIDEKPVFIARLIVNSWIFQMLNARARRMGFFTAQDIERVLTEAENERGEQRYTHTTIPRRRRTVVAWLKWLADQAGCYAWDVGKETFELR